MGQILQLLLRFLWSNWPCISIVGGLCGFLGYHLGMRHIRHVLAPRLCPECLRKQQWQDEMLRQARGKTPDEKRDSRKFYWLRRRGPPPGGE